jgi:GDSL-like Lipase/Acylhydrolase family
MTQPATHQRGRQALRSVGTALLITLLSLAAIEIVLRIVDLRVLREVGGERSLSYRYDQELGWTPTPDSRAVVTTARTIHVQHNSLGFRDIEFARDGRPAMLFIGDSFVWGVDAEAEERFTDLLRRRISSHTIVNAGVSGFGTDQEYLLLQRIWPQIQPKVVVLMFCTDNDRIDNRVNIRYDGYQKPYFATEADNSLVLRGQPVPKSRQLYFKEDWRVRHSWLVRAAVYAYLEIQHPPLHVPDPTERLVSKIREFVEARGARLLVGLQSRDDKLVQHLQTERIPFVVVDGAEAYSAQYGSHWTPKGHRRVAEQLWGLLAETNIVRRDESPR